ncbi:NLR family CARD domain-containing protein 3-like isoform X2 [Montipora capricornis]|uniref:NLR family CARD domain-containing protein 3-like isoform X2 n=1 Tax=Montipora capricornis TaxID=246305 RepID=UPI0035F1F9F6
MEGGKKGKLCLPVLENCYGMPPQLKVKPPKLSGLQRVSKPWGSVDLPIDILLLTVEDCEFLSCYSFLGQPVKSYNMEVGTIYFGYIGTDQNQLKVALKTCAKGSVVPGGSSAAVKNAVRVLRPKAVFLVGTCRGLTSDKVKLGDVVVSAKLTTPAGFKIPVSSHLGDLVRDAPFGWVAPLENPDELEVKVHCDGDILSQAEWCKVADLQKQYPESIAVETEGEGVFAAAYDEKVEWVIVKSVASFVNQTQPSSSEWMSFASTMAASVVAKMISDPAVFKDWPHCNQGILTKRLKTDEGSSKDTLKETHEMSKHLKDKFSEMEGNQERANEQLVKIEEMVKHLQPCERNSKECLKDEQDPIDLVNYMTLIRKLYEDREGWLAPFPWCEEFRFNLDNIFTRLKFVSRKKERGIKTDESVDMFQIFQPHKECSQPKRVLIEGQPGMGKTTYCHKIAFNWAKERKGGESFPDVLLVLLLKCKDINFSLWEAIDDQLLPREVNEEEKERFFTFIRDNQSKVLLVLDGLDELPRSELSIYKEIIQGRVLPESYLVVTARHEVGMTVRECCHTLLEVEGFTKTDAKNFIQKYFREREDLAEKLLDKLDSDITLQDLTANPLNATLLCLLCEDFGGQLPESRTLVYLEIVECVLRRHRLKMKLPETDEDLVALYQVELKQLGRIAMEGLENDSVYFDQSAFQGFSSDLQSGLGFLSVEAGRSKRRPGRSYSFLHMSFQEFFAAHHLCCQLLDEEISVDSLVADLRYFNEFQQVLMFTIGMLAQKCEAAVKALIAGTATQVNLKHCRLEVALACINECKRGENTFDKEMAQFFGSHLQLEDADCFGLNRELAAVCIETMKTDSTVTSLQLGDCNIDDASFAALSELLRKENSTLEWLYLSDNAIGEVGADALAKGLKENSTLTSLNLFYNAIGDVGADALAKGLKENSTLTSLDLSNNAIGAVGADALAKGLKENSTLTSLNLFYNAIGDVGADALAKGLKENSTLTWLHLSNNAIGAVGADALAKGLKENSTLTSLGLSGNAIGDVGADVLAKGMKENSTLTCLKLSNNAIGDVGADALAKGLKENSTLEWLQLSGNAIGDVGADALAKGLKENSTLTRLELSHNKIGDVGADALAKGLKENSTLEWLQLSGNAIGDVGADALAKGMKENSTLTRLELSNNAIGEVGADALAKGLKENSTLEWLQLSGNAIGDVGADALAKGMKENSTLTRLELSNNAIGDVGADALAKGLKENSTLTWLDLSNNAIGATSVLMHSNCLIM